jgi:hypothetical protein
MGSGQQQQAEKGRAHTDGQRIGIRLLVGDRPDDRLQQRRGALEGKRQQADLPELKIEVGLQHRVDRRDHRLHDVVEHMAEARRQDDRQDGLLGHGGRWRADRLRGGIDHEVFSMQYAAASPCRGKLQVYSCGFVLSMPMNGPAVRLYAIPLPLRILGAINSCRFGKLWGSVRLDICL